VKRPVEDKAVRPPLVEPAAMVRRYICAWRINRRCNPERARWSAHRWVARLAIRRRAWVLASNAEVRSNGRGGRVIVYWQLEEDAGTVRPPDSRHACVAAWPVSWAMRFDEEEARQLRDELAPRPRPPREVSPRELARRRAWWVRHRHRLGIAPGYLARHPLRPWESPFGDEREGTA
jgi:hypothetical protein